MFNKLKKVKIFTLLEILIVVGIITVLGGIAAIVLTNWFSKGINAKKYSTLKTIYQGVILTYVKDGEYIHPSKAINIMDSKNNLLGYQGVIDDDVIKRGLNLNKTPKDPSNGDYFSYTKYVDNKGFEVGVFVQDILSSNYDFKNKAYSDSTSMLPYVQTYGRINYCEGKFPNPLSMYDNHNNKFLSEYNLGKGSKIVLEVDNLKKLVRLNTKFLMEGQSEGSCNSVAPIKCVFGTKGVNELSSAYPNLGPVIDNYSTCIDVQINRCENENQCNKPDVYAFHNNYIYLLYKANDGSYILEQIEKGNEKNFHQFVLGNNIGKILNLVFLDEYRYIVIYEKLDGTVYYQTFDSKNGIVKEGNEIQLESSSLQVNSKGGKVYENGSAVSGVSSLITYGSSVEGGGGLAGGANLVGVSSNGVKKINSLLEPECICRLPQLIDVYNDIYVIVYEKDGKTYLRTTKNSSSGATIISDYKLLDGSIDNTNFLKLRDEIYGVLYKGEDGKGYLVSLSIDKNYEIKSILDIYSFTLDIEETPSIYNIGNYEFALMGTKSDLTNITLVSVDEIGKITKLNKEIPQIFCPVKKMVQISTNTFGYVCLYEDKLTYEQISISNGDKSSNSSSLIEGDYKTILQASETVVDVVCESGFYKMNGTCLPIPVGTFIGCEPGTISSNKYPSIHYSFPKIKEGVITYSLLEKNGEVYVANIKCQNQNPYIDSETKGTVIYRKGTNNNYFSTSNWSGGVVPGESDIAVINGGNIVFDLGSGPITVGPIKLGLTTASSITLVNGSVANGLIVKGPLHIGTNGNITHPNNDAVINHIVNLNVKGELSIDGKIDVSTKGYKGGPIGMNGNGPNFGKRGDRGGGGGGLGGNGHSGGAGAGGGSSQSMETIELGSGGGSGWGNRRKPGGNGGGAAKIVANSVVLNGSINANGEFQNGCAGGGAGGMIYLITDSVIGPGSFNTNGANGGGQGCWSGGGGGGGGGGKIVIKGDYSSFSGQFNVNGGLGGNGYARHGQVGDIYFEHNDNVVLKNIAFTVNSEYLNNLNNKNKVNLVSSTINKSDTSTIQINEITLNGSTLNLTNGSIKVNKKLLVSSSTINWSGGEFDLVSSNIDFGGASILNSSVSKEIKGKNISVLGSSSVTHNPNGTTVNNYINLYALENLTIDGTINVDAKGYNGGPYQGHGAGPYYGRGASKGGGGGGNGGAGTSGRGGAGGGADPDKLTVSLGSGGGGGGGNGSGPGGNGGGIVKIQADGNININGGIYARGVSNGACAGGGAGGSIYLKSPSVYSKGVLNVAGGAGRGGNCWGGRGGAGGGGKIIISATEFVNNGSLTGISSTGLNNGTYKKIDY